MLLPAIELSEEERGLLAGEGGEAARLAMQILVRMAPIYGAKSLLPVTRAHIDGCIYEGDAGLEFAERLAAHGGRVAVPTSLNVISLDRARWQEHGLSPDYADKARRLGQAYVDMGAVPTFTCAPYQIGHQPAFGEQIAWSESNAVTYANSIIGARTNRYGDYLDVSCALVGRVPASGLHLTENRLGQVLVTLRGIPPELFGEDDFYPVMGYLLGTIVDEEIPVVAGIEAAPTDDQLKAMSAATSTSGSIALFHLIGVTPEAPTQADVFGGRPPQREVVVTMNELRAARAELTTSAGDELDVVAFGSPHCSLAECRTLADLMVGQRAAPNVEVWVTTSRAVRELAGRAGFLAQLEEFGARVTADTCIAVSPLVKRGSRAMMTNSAKYAHYAPGLIGVQSIFGSTNDCVASAIAGRVLLHPSRAWSA